MWTAGKTFCIFWKLECHETECKLSGQTLEILKLFIKWLFPQGNGHPTSSEVNRTTTKWTEQENLPDVFCKLGSEWGKFFTFWFVCKSMLQKFAKHLRNLNLRQQTNPPFSKGKLQETVITVSQRRWLNKVKSPTTGYRECWTSLALIMQLSSAIP